MDNSVVLENLSEASGGPSVSKDRDKDRYVKILPYCHPFSLRYNVNPER